jgi:hypothetical protein
MRPLNWVLKSSFWALTTYRETAQAFRVLRFNCIKLVTPLREIFEREVGRVLDDFRARHRLETREAAFTG